jgi:hypothetical protein
MQTTSVNKSSQFKLLNKFQNNKPIKSSKRILNTPLLSLNSWRTHKLMIIQRKFTWTNRFRSTAIIVLNILLIRMFHKISQKKTLRKNNNSNNNTNYNSNSNSNNSNNNNNNNNNNSSKKKKIST